MRARLTTTTDPVLDRILAEAPLPDPFRREVSFVIVVDEPEPAGFVSFHQQDGQTIWFQGTIRPLFRPGWAVFNAVIRCLRELEVPYIITRIDDHWPRARLYRRLYRRLGCQRYARNFELGQEWWVLHLVETRQEVPA